MSQICDNGPFRVKFKTVYSRIEIPALAISDDNQFSGKAKLAHLDEMQSNHTSSSLGNRLLTLLHTTKE